MKRLLLLTALLMAFVFALPILTVGLHGGRDGAAAPEAEGEADTPSYDAGMTITLCHEDQVIELDLHTYLCGVVAAEMPAAFPEEALRAQALAARTYSLYQLALYDKGKAIPAQHKGAQLCTDHTHCKAYTDLEAESTNLWGKNAAYYRDRITSAVEDTDGMVATWEGQPIAAVFHSTASARTESALAVWGNDTPYLVSVESPGGEASPRWKGEVVLTQQAFKEKLLAAHPEIELPADPHHWFKASERSEAGGIIEVSVGGKRLKGTEIRTLLGLNSTNFTFEVLDSGDLSFKTTGYGHGVGMSQYGAKALAEEGKSFEEIIQWYYTGVEIERLQPAGGA